MFLNFAEGERMELYPWRIVFVILIDVEARQNAEKIAECGNVFFILRLADAGKRKLRKNDGNQNAEKMTEL